MEKKFREKILKLALPITMQQFMLALVSACDTFMLGELNQNSLSAVSLASQVTFVFNLILAALTIGENMFVAQYYGNKNPEGVRISAGFVLKYVLLVSGLFMTATILIPQILMRLFTNDMILIEYGIEYLRLIGFLQVYQCILKNCGYVGKCTVISMIVVGINIALNAIFIYGCFGFPGMGIAGAEKSGNILCKIAVVSGCLTGGILLLLIPVVLYLTNLTDTATEYLKYMLIMSSYYVIGKSVNSMTIGGIFPAGGDTKFGMKCDSITMWCFAVPLGYIAAFVLKWPVLIVYFVLNLDELVKIPAVFKHYRKYKWLNNLTGMEN